MRILHVLRAPLGGLLRHVVDLAHGQVERGHDVGLIADSREQNAIGEEALRELAPKLALGICRFPISRQPGPGDLAAIWHVAARIRATRADVVHGHGAKGGALVRLAPATHSLIRAYTPHGGSLHEAVGGWLGILLERTLKPFGQLYLFESEYSYDIYRSKVGQSAGVMRVVHNGIRKEELEPIAPAADACDIVYLGEMRRLKGVDLLIDALASLRRNGFAVTAALIGDGPDAAQFQAKAAELGISDLVTFANPMPARQAFARGRVVVLPSRAESLPYVVLEAAAAAKPIVATKVGGIPEIFGPFSDRLVAPEDAPALAQAILAAVQSPDQVAAISAALRARMKDLFSVERMVESVLSAYCQARAKFQQPYGLDGAPRFLPSGKLPEA